MIEIDMRMPHACLSCPCSYHVQTGPMEGMMICEILEYKQAKVITVNGMDRRPKNCPMRERREENA